MSLGDIRYVGKADGQSGLRKRIWGCHLNPNYLEKRHSKSQPKDDFQRSCKVLNGKGEICVDKSVLRRRIGRELKLAPGQAIDYILKNLAVSWVTFPPHVGDIPQIERELIRELNPRWNESGAKRDSEFQTDE